MDHIGGLLDSKDNIYFKNAKVYVSKEEYGGLINNMPTNKSGLQVKSHENHWKTISKVWF